MNNPNAFRETYQSRRWINQARSIYRSKQKMLLLQSDLSSLKLSFKRKQWYD